MQMMPNVEVQIVKMRESSGNEQFFVRMFRTDHDEGIFCIEGMLEYRCYQTKFLEKEKCLERAWFDASYLARWVGFKTMDSVKLIGVNAEETEILKNSLSRI